VTPTFRQHPRAAWLVVAALVLGCGYLAWTLVFRLASLPSDPNSSASDGSFDRLRIIDFEHTVYAGQNPVLSLHADEIVHRNRSLGPVAINPIKELIFTGVSIKMTAPEEIPATGGGAATAYVAPLMRQMLTQTDLGLVSRVTLKDLELTMSGYGVPIFSLSAKHMTIGLEESAVVLSQGFRLISANGDRLRAGGARWKARAQSFEVNGPYRLTTAAGPAHGSGGVFRIDPAGAIAH
jgi:hypothetical protein